MSHTLWDPSLASIYPVDRCCFLLVTLFFPEVGFSGVAVYSMFPEVWSATTITVFFLVQCCVGCVGGLARQLDFKGFGFPLHMNDFFAGFPFLCPW